VHEIRQFLGLCGYFRRYVRNYAQFVTPLHEMTKLAEPFIWMEERDTAYETLKTSGVFAINIRRYQLGGRSRPPTGAGWIAPSDRLRVQSVHRGQKTVLYNTQGVSSHDIRIKTLSAIPPWQKFIVRADHAALSYLMTAKDLIRQQACWVNLMSEFDFTIQHRAGVSHTNADALSRKIPCELSGIDCRQCHRHIRNTSDMPDGPGCRHIRVVAAGPSPVAHRHIDDMIQAQPVRTRAQARMDSE